MCTVRLEPHATSVYVSGINSPKTQLRNVSETRCRHPGLTAATALPALSLSPSSSLSKLPQP